MIYVRKSRCHPWHYAANCTKLPKPENITQRVEMEGKTRPSSGELDNECRSLERRGLAEPIQGA